MEDLLVVGGLIAGTWLLLLWLSIIVWVYRDIRERTRDIGLQVLAVFVAMMFFPGFNIPGLALYLMMRPRESLEEAYSRSLEEEALLREIGDEGLCPSCRRFVERSWRVCPFCQTQLKDVCARLPAVAELQLGRLPVLHGGTKDGAAEADADAAAGCRHRLAAGRAAARAAASTGPRAAKTERPERAPGQDDGDENRQRETARDGRGQAPRKLLRRPRPQTSS